MFLKLERNLHYFCGVYFVFFASKFQEMVILVLAVELTGDQLSLINAMGLLVCLLGIIGHIVHKFMTANNNQQLTHSIKYPSRLSQGFIVTEKLDGSGFENHDISLFRRNTSYKSKGEHSVPLMSDMDAPSTSRRADNLDNHSGDSDVDSNRILFDILQRRDTVR